MITVSFAVTKYTQQHKTISMPDSLQITEAVMLSWSLLELHTMKPVLDMTWSCVTYNTQYINPLKDRGVNWLHFAIQV